MLFEPLRSTSLVLTRIQRQCRMDTKIDQDQESAGGEDTEEELGLSASGSSILALTGGGRKGLTLLSTRSGTVQYLVTLFKEPVFGVFVIEF